MAATRRVGEWERPREAPLRLQPAALALEPNVPGLASEAHLELNRARYPQNEGRLSRELGAGWLDERRAARKQRMERGAAAPNVK